MDNTLILFARNPELGKVKTRLAKDLGDEKALNVYNQLLDNTLKTARIWDSKIKVYWSEECNTDKEYYYQNGGDLGERMYDALTTEVKHGPVCLVGTDTPYLTSKILANAFEALEQADVVFGPSKDGGYYLVGAKEVLPKELFLNKIWSHKEVLKDALTTCANLDLKVELMPTLLDIDTIDDYKEWNLAK